MVFLTFTEKSERGHKCQKIRAGQPQPPKHEHIKMSDDTDKEGGGSGVGHAG